MDETGRILIAQSGFTSVVKDKGSAGGDMDETEYAMRCYAPEILSEGEASKQGVIFSFVMLMIEASHREFHWLRVLFWLTIVPHQFRYSLRFHSVINQLRQATVTTRTPRRHRGAEVDTPMLGSGSPPAT